jgi:hypothetical protein
MTVRYESPEQTLRVKIAADLYNRADDPHPARTVAEHLGVNERTAFRLIAAAKKRDLITRTVPAGVRSQLVHGTLQGYRRHNCRCDDCRRAHKRHNQKRRERRFATRDTADFMHNASGYTNWGCRCALCKADHHDAMVAAYQSRLDRGLRK